MSQNRLSAFSKIADQREYTELDAAVVFSGLHNDWVGNKEDLAQELLDLREKAARLIQAEELLKRVEFGGAATDDAVCPECSWFESHSPECELAAFLKGIK